MVDRLVEQPEARVSARPPDRGFLHRPYGGSRQPFAIGLSPLDPRAWLEDRAGLPALVDERERLIEADLAAVFREEPGSRAAQDEALEAIAAHLTRDHPQTWRREAGMIQIVPARRSIRLRTGEPALLTAGRLVSEDLVILEPGRAGPRLTAAILCFPSAWCLADKFGQALDTIHTEVPGFLSHLAATTNRLFERLRPGQTVCRFNWSIYPDDRLHHPAPPPKRPGWPESADDAFIRVERQTLHRLPRTGAVLFTIGIHLDPLAALATHPQGGLLAAGLRRQLDALTPEQAAYKGLTAHRARLSDLLAGLTREA